MNIQLSSLRRYRGRTQRDQRRTAGFTLVEMLVAMAITLILILALAQAYAVVGQTLAEGRAIIELAGSFRFVAHRLQDDLDRGTVIVRPPLSEALGMGYFEILDGETTDSTTANDPTLNMFGDIDDILAFTARRDDSPFIGEYNYQPLDSGLAEIVWWIQNESGSNSRDEPFAIYRRVLLVRPDYDPHGFGPGILARPPQPRTFRI
jgi:prepilin-type N-terminal cleavage/methylation domain-containing protein